MSNFSTFFPAPGGGGGGILNEQIFTASGSFDPAAAGLAIGDKVSLFICGGGGGGNSYASARQATGASGGLVKQAVFTLNSIASISVTIGAGGTSVSGSAIAGGAGGNTSVSGSGVSLTATGGEGGYGTYYVTGGIGYSPGTSDGPHWGATSGINSNVTYGSGGMSSAGPGVNGYGAGGFSVSADFANGSGAISTGTYAMEGTGGGSGSGVYAGKSGIVKIYY